MGWTLHHPEEYNRACQEGIVYKLERQFPGCFSPHCNLYLFVDQLATSAPEVLTALVHWAWPEIKQILAGHHEEKEWHRYVS